LFHARDAECVNVHNGVRAGRSGASRWLPRVVCIVKPVRHEFTQQVIDVLLADDDEVLQTLIFQGDDQRPVIVNRPSRSVDFPNPLLVSGSKTLSGNVTPLTIESTCNHIARFRYS